MWLYLLCSNTGRAGRAGRSIGIWFGRQREYWSSALPAESSVKSLWRHIGPLFLKCSVVSVSWYTNSHGTRISGFQKLDNFVMGQEIGETDINIIQSQ